MEAFFLGDVRSYLTTLVSQTPAIPVPEDAMPSVLHVHFHVCGEHELTQTFTYINKDKQIFKELTVTKSMLIKLMSYMGTAVKTTKGAGPCLGSASLSYPLILQVSSRQKLHN